MDAKNRLFLAGLALILMISLSGCAGYGKIMRASLQGDSTTIRTLVKDWQDYEVYYSGVDATQPYGIMFDKKGDDKSLKSNLWVKVKDQETLSDMVQWMSLIWMDTSRLFRIIGPDNQFYGYMFTPWTAVTIKEIGKNTLFVYDLKLKEGPKTV